MLVCEGTVDDYSMDCTADMNAQWEDLAAILNLSSIQGSSLGGQDRTYVYGFSYSSKARIQNLSHYFGSKELCSLPSHVIQHPVSG